VDGKGGGGGEIGRNWVPGQVISCCASYYRNGVHVLVPETVLDSLGGIPPVLVDLATFGLALLGGFVALKPPAETDKVLKRFYVGGFAFLFVVGMAANIWQRRVEGAKQDQLQQNETDARNQFSTDLHDLKVSNNAILEFVASPPKGSTQEQVSSIVREYIRDQKSGQEILSNGVLRAMETTTERQMYDIWDQFNRSDINLDNQQNSASPEQVRRIAAARDQLRKQLLDNHNNQQVLASANFVRDQLLRRLAISDTTQDWVTSGIEQFGASNQAYLQELADKLPK
jgi:hypothetical protein